MAIPLTTFLTTGTYDGFDIVERGVRGCQKRISPAYPNFRFQHLPASNGIYNPAGAQRGDTVRFPYADNSFDFAFLTSVFTHLRPADVSHYLRELARVLEPGGTLFATAFVLDGRSDTAWLDGRPVYRFTIVDGPARYPEGIAEAAVGYDFQWLRDEIVSAGFEPPVLHAGQWDGSPNGVTYQDILVSRRS